ncbi:MULTISPECIES: squalene--hopene cyclase [unclassified Paenibacillus]|uniref:squalene--hopene cyclase n=1 Tax=unclassified Paenibacillus TaxID=185978 RepID=UPI001AE4085B|nr:MULTISPECIES: squalene--hopene cyclase [unclassified Paenibacillus]MBP1153829.1 sporulenol synthase [Paenibacillus sp. PvP091]MBP1170786.1 sporulenol synthase [Paenibacillus sp. PvR098]MBP2441814.1 sporulenol synthase [Paenibacillus sp. PvP052]
MNNTEAVETAMNRLAKGLLKQQSPDGSWRFCFENGILTDAYTIILLRSLKINDEHLIRRLASRILDKQRPEGYWTWYHDDENGHLSATVEAYYALLFSGVAAKTDVVIQKAKRYILRKGGLGNVSGLLTKVMLAMTGQVPWPRFNKIPIEIMLLPSSLPISFHDLSSYARVHLAPVLVMADLKFAFRTESSPDLSDLLVSGPGAVMREPEEESRWFPLAEEIKAGIQKFALLPEELHQQALQRAERYMLDRIEPNGTLYSYASSTLLMIYALLALRYDTDHPVIQNAVQGLKSLACETEGQLHIQNSPSTVWDTALISHSLQESGYSAEHPAIVRADAYLLSRQHTKSGDWSLNLEHPLPGGWGFSDVNTIIPDVDDTTAALRALRQTAARSGPPFREARDRGLSWVLSMQNKDGGWPAFEKGKDHPLLTRLPVDGADAAAIDPSTADLTGRTLEYLGNEAALDLTHPFVLHGADWLIRHQKPDGSWYGRWGICYIYGTWAALTGLMAVGVSAQHASAQQAASWLTSIQNPDGGWGESCRSDQVKAYVPLKASTLSQTAWALDALVAVHPEPTDCIQKGILALADMAQSGHNGWTAEYPTGAGLPGNFYTRYHSYNYIWPLLTLAHYKKKYG